jgi:S1-C subfamily serine protease
VLGLLAGAARAADAEHSLETIELEVCALYDAAKDAVVEVHAQRRLVIGNLSAASAPRIGTGFFIRNDGVLLTAAAIVRGMDSYWIEWHDTERPARLLGWCDRTNLAVLQVDATTPFLRLGDSDTLRVGSMVVTIGYPFDLPSVPVPGWVTGLDIRRGSNVFATTHVRANCKLSPGQAGAPVLNARGEAVGIALAAHLDDQCYALPIRAAQRVCQDILQHGQPRFGWVGLEVSERLRAPRPSRERQTEVIVRQVFPATPAAAAGFQAGDELVRITTNDVRNLADVLDTMFYRRSGEWVEFTVLRSNQEVRVSLTVGSRPGVEPRPAKPPVTEPPTLPGMVPVSQEP